MNSFKNKNQNWFFTAGVFFAILVSTSVLMFTTRSAWAESQEIVNPSPERIIHKDKARFGPFTVVREFKEDGNIKILVKYYGQLKEAKPLKILVTAFYSGQIQTPLTAYRVYKMNQVSSARVILSSSPCIKNKPSCIDPSNAFMKQFLETLFTDTDPSHFQIERMYFQLSAYDQLRNLIDNNSGKGYRLMFEKTIIPKSGKSIESLEDRPN